LLLLQAIVYHSSPDAPQVADKIAEDYNVRSKAYQADTSDQKKMHEIVKQVYDDLGPVGGIVCNAGRASQKPALEATREDFDACFDTNVWGAFVSAQACAALWKEHGYQNGKVVIVSCESVSVLVARGVYPRSAKLTTRYASAIAISGSIANKGSQQCFYNASKVRFNVDCPAVQQAVLMCIVSQPS
jgi:sorbose reductase